MTEQTIYARYPSKGEYPEEVDDVVLACYDAVIDPDNEERCLKPDRYAHLAVNDLDTSPYWYHAYDEDGDEVGEPDWWIPLPRPFAARPLDHSEEAIKIKSIDLAMAAQDFLFEKQAYQPHLVTAHIGELTLTLMVVASTAGMNVSDRLGAALSKIANSVMNEHIAGDKSGDKPNT